MKKAPSIVCSFLFILGPIALGSRLGASQTGPAMPDDVKAVFKERCAVCHKGKYPPKQLNLEPEGLPASLLNAPSREQPALRLVDTASPETSYLLKKIKGGEGITGKIMPPPGKTALTGDEIARIESWIIGLKEGRPDIAFRGGGFGSGGLLASSAPAQAPAGNSKKAKSAYEKPPFWGTRLVNLPTGMTMDKGGPGPCRLQGHRERMGFRDREEDRRACLPVLRHGFHRAHLGPVRHGRRPAPRQGRSADRIQHLPDVLDRFR